MKHSEEETPHAVQRDGQAMIPKPIYAPYDKRSGINHQWLAERWDSNNYPTSYRSAATPVRVVLINGKWALCNERGRGLRTRKRGVVERKKHLLNALKKAETILHSNGRIVSCDWR